MQSKNIVDQLLMPFPLDLGPGEEVVLPAWAIELMTAAANRIRGLEMALGVTHAAAKDIQVLEWSPDCSCDICRKVGQRLAVGCKVAEAALAGETGPKDPAWLAFEPLMLSLLALPEETIGKRAALQGASRLRSSLSGSGVAGELSPTPAAAARPHLMGEAFSALLLQLENLPEETENRGDAINALRRLHLAFSPPGTPVLITNKPQTPTEMTP